MTGLRRPPTTHPIVWVVFNRETTIITLSSKPMTIYIEHLHKCLDLCFAGPGVVHFTQLNNSLRIHPPGRRAMRVSRR